MKRWLHTSQLARGYRKRRPEAGYTITEVMVVLAVSAMTFAAIALVFSGRQGGVEFSQAVRDYEARMQSTMNEVTSGYYQSNFRCSLDSYGNPSINSAVAKDTGTNEACIFIGKTIIPAESPGTTSTVSTLVGRRVITDGGTERDVETIAEAQPVVVPTSETSFTHSFGLRVREIQNLGSSSDSDRRLFGLGFFSQLARGSLPTGGDVSGGEGLIKLYGLLSPNLAGGNNVVNPSQLVLLPEGAVLCLVGQNGKFAEVTIGENNSQSTIASTLDTAEAGEKCSGL